MAKHDPDPVHLVDVALDRARLGAPIIRCVEWSGELYALEGSHRLAVAWKTGVAYVVFVQPPGGIVGFFTGINGR
jgi:hypothetical protein